MGMANKEVDWFAESNRYATLLMEQGLKAEQEKGKHREQKIVTNGTILADLLQVVRCKDCKYFFSYCDGFYGCGTFGLPRTQPDCFCSRGERKES